jgi:ubiquinone/menaquinone biosynthesis C-methylase UbiE
VSASLNALGIVLEQKGDIVRNASDGYGATSTGHQLADAGHLDKHYYALQSEYEEALRSSGFQSSWRVLDAGCGNGVYLPLLAELVGRRGAISVIDLAPENIEQVNELAKGGNLACQVEPCVGDLTALPYEDNQFEGLWSANVTQYLTDSQLSQAMREFRRVVKPNGLIAIKEVDISVWQFQPLDPKLLWRLLELVSQDGTQMAGAMRGTRLPLWFREAELTEIRSRTTLAERRHPLKRVEHDYIRSNLEFLAKLAASQLLPVGDVAAWKAIGIAPSELIEVPDFCYREMFVVTTGRVRKD